MAFGLPLNALMLEAHPAGDTLQATLCGSTNFSFDLQTIGGCTTPTLDSVFIAGLDSSEYQIIRTAHTVGEDVPDTSWVTIAPAQEGIKTFTVTARYRDAGNNVLDTSFVLTLNVAPAQSLSVHLSPGSLSDTDQGMVSIPIYASAATPVTSGTVMFRLVLRTDLLTPESIFTSIANAGTASLQADDSGVWITITFPPNFSISSDTLLATLVCRVFVTDTNETAIAVASAPPTATNCLSIQSTGGTTFTLIPHCGDAQLTRYLGTGSALTIASIQPNPAGDEIAVRVVGGDPSAILQCELYDALGRGMGVRRTPLRSGVSLDVSQVPSGIYFLRVSSGGYVQSRSVAVQH